MNPDFSGLFGGGSTTAAAPKSTASSDFSNLFTDELKQQSQLNQAKQQEQTQLKQTAPIAPPKRSFLSSIGHDITNSAKAVGRGTVRAGKAIGRPTVDIATGQGGKFVHDTSQLSSDVSGGTVNQFAKAAVNAPLAVAREAQNKPITDIQKNVFGTTNQEDIAKKIIGSTVGTASMFVGGGAAKGAIKAGTAAEKALPTFLKSAGKLGTAGAAGNVGATITNNPNASAKQLTISGAEGFGAGVAAAGVGAGAARLIKGAPGAASKATSKIAQVAKKADSKLGESGAVKPGAVVSDVKSLVNKYEAPTTYSKDIQTAGRQIEGIKNQIQSDTLKTTKGLPKLSVVEKRTIQNYRDAKEAGQPTRELAPKLQTVNDQITKLNQATFKALDERDTFNGIKPSAHPNAETYVHREVQGKGSPLEQIAQGSRTAGQVKTGFGKTIPSEKGRVFQAVTDDQGNRQVVAIKNESFGKVKHVYSFDNNQNMSKLGKFNYDSKASTITDAKGNSYKLGQATVNEIEQATGKKYIVDPLLTSLKNYTDARTASENFKFIESLKQHPDFEKFAAPPSTNAPKNWKPVPGFLQFAGYKFEPKVAEAMRDIGKNIGSYDEPRLADALGNLLKKTIVYFPLKHDLNMGVAYAVDRGLTGVANPLALRRGAISIAKAFNEVTNQGPVFQELQRKGFSLVTSEADRTKLNNFYQKELKNVLGNKRTIAEVAKQWGSTPARIYKAVQNLSVWEVQDILNVARVMERMQPTLLGKGQSLEDAMKATQKFSFQYKVPSRVGGKLLPGRAGRSASRFLQSKVIFFGPYTYDKYKIISNVLKDTVNLKSLVKNPRQNAQAVDKLAALAVGAGTVWPLVNKGLQSLTGDKNAHVTAPGPLAPIETALKVKKGLESPTTAITSQTSLNPLITEGMNQYTGTDSFTGKKFADPNAPLPQQLENRGKHLLSQLAPAQKVAGVKNATQNKALSTALSLAGVSLPKNSPQTTKLLSLKNDSLPLRQSEYKAAVVAGNMAKANQIKNQYNQQALEAFKATLKAEGKPIPSDQRLLFDLKKGQYLFTVSNKTIRGYQNPKKQQQTTIDKLLRVRP